MLVGEIPQECENGYYVKPVIFTDVTSQMTIAREEIFGPVLSVIFMIRWKKQSELQMTVLMDYAEVFLERRKRH